MNKIHAFCATVIAAGAGAGGYFLTLGPSVGVDSGGAVATAIDFTADRRKAPGQDEVVIDLPTAGPFVAGERVAVELPLLRAGGGQWLLKDYSTSCGCMKLSNGDGELPLPFRVAAGKASAAKLQIDTTGRRGGNLFFAKLAGLRSEKPFACEFRISVDVEPAWVVEPPVLKITKVRPGQVVNRRVDVYDGVQERSLQIEDIRTSDDVRIKVRWEEDSGPPLLITQGAWAARSPNDMSCTSRIPFRTGR